MSRLKVVGDSPGLKSVTVLIFPNPQLPTLLGQEVTQKARDLDLKWATARYIDIGGGKWQTRLTLRPRNGRAIKTTMDLREDASVRSVDDLLLYLGSQIKLEHARFRLEQTSKPSDFGGGFIAFTS